MIGICASTELHTDILNSVNEHDRLYELIQLYPLPSEDEIQSPDGHTICISDAMIWMPEDWWQAGPPVCIPPIPYSPGHVVGLVLFKLHNFEEAARHLSHLPECWDAVQLYACILNGITGKALSVDDKNYTALHNHAVCLHYASESQSLPLEQQINAYNDALSAAIHPGQVAFTSIHLATLLTDSGMCQYALDVLSPILETEGLDTHALHHLKWMRCITRLQMIGIPYNIESLEALKSEMWEVLGYFEKWNRIAEQGLLLTEAAHIANISESFAEGLGYINKAIQLLHQEELPHLEANAQLKKGILLYTWAQKGQPQFFRAAKDALQAALQIFTRDTAPHIFADIHHYLGIIYSEIPDEVQKKSVWAGVSVSSFNEALNFYNKVDYPYQFAQICHHFGNAFTKYPAAALGDNFEKALNWYREALDIRTAHSYPLERSLTLSNYLAAAWKAGNPGDGWNEERWLDMWEKILELKMLATDESLASEAIEWENLLIKLKSGSV